MEPNYDESKVPVYTLPPVWPEGMTPERWRDEFRPRLLRQFAELLYGEIPPPPEETRPELRAERAGALNGLAVRREFRLHFRNGTATAELDVLLYLPTRRPGRVPAFCGLNFYGNHSVTPEADVFPSSGIGPEGPIRQDQVGAYCHRLPLTEILTRGFAAATAFYGQLCPDQPGAVETGIHRLVPGCARPATALAAWAWGLLRIRELLARQPELDPAQIGVFGHSRLGKAALWAGVNDERFARVISNDSGEGGAALTRRCFGESVAAITSRFPHWFTPRFAEFAGRENELPVDQHQLLALVAPRPLHVASAAEDLWADPRGEFLAWREALPVWRALGIPVPEPGDELPPNGGIPGYCAYHRRPGVHDLLPEDWACYLDWAAAFSPVTGGR